MVSLPSEKRVSGQVTVGIGVRGIDVSSTVTKLKTELKLWRRTSLKDDDRQTSEVQRIQNKRNAKAKTWPSQDGQGDERRKQTQIGTEQFVASGRCNNEFGCSF